MPKMHLPELETGSIPATVNDALHRLPALRVAVTDNPLHICIDLIELILLFPDTQENNLPCRHRLPM